MPPVGRPRTRTKTGSAPPTTEVGVPDINLGVGSISVGGQNVGWSQFVDQHEFVDEWRWPNSVRTVDRMRTDTQLAALFTAVAWGIAQLRYIINPNGARDSLVKEISEDLNLPIRGQDDQPRGRLKRRFSHSQFISEALLAILYGHMYFEQVGEIVNGKWRLRKLAARMPQSIENIHVADDGGLVSIQQFRSMNKPVLGPPPEVPVDRLVAFIFQKEGPSWVGRSMLRDCYKDWLIKDRLIRVDAINHERAGGVPYVEAPPGATPGEIDDLNIMAQRFRVGESGGGALPYGAKLNIARGTGSSVDKSIHSRDESMARRFLLQLMNLAQSGQHVGSYALGETFEDFFIVGQRHIAQWYCDTMTEHVIEDYTDWNYGEEEKLVPQITWERTSEDALGVDQLSELVQRGVIVMDDDLENAIRYKYRLPKADSPRATRQKQEGTGAEVTPGGPKQPPDNKQPGAGTGTGAPSSQEPAPAPTKASLGLSVFDWERDPAFGKPEVMAAAPVLVTVPNVPILEAGVEYALSTGKTTFTPEDLMDAVMAANEDPSIPSPRLKLGHIDPRFNGPEFDATPAFGKATNLRLADNGMVVYADYVGVPKWLAEILPAAFPNRSVEGFWNISSGVGKKWRFVLSACSLLGVQWPGIMQLEDLPDYYGEEVPPDVVVTAAAGGDQVKFRKTKATASLDDVRRAFYNDYIPNQSGSQLWWVRAVLTDPNQLVCEDDGTGDLYLIPFNSDDKGNVSFGEAENVRVEYVPDEAKKAAATHVAAALVTGREALATYATRAESSPEPTGGGMDPKEIRQRLGLPEDATDEQVQQSLRELSEAAGMQATPNATSGGATGVGTGTPEEQRQAAEVGQQSQEGPITPTETGSNQPSADAAEADRQAGAGSQASAETVVLDKETFESLQRGAHAGLTMQERFDAQERERTVAAAIEDGRIPPARKDHWLTALKADFEGNSQVLASLQPGLVPVTERGSNETNDVVENQGKLVQSWTDDLFPEVTARRTQEQQIRGGQQRFPRVMSDKGRGEEGFQA